MAVHALPGRDPLSNPLLERELSQRYLIFDAFVSGERRVDVHPLVLSAPMHRAAVAAAEGAYRVVAQAAARAHADPQERARYGLHPDVLRLAAASHGAGDLLGLARVDLLFDADGGWRACEINADCPGGHNEALGLPRLAQAAGFWEGLDPTTVVSAAVERLAELARGKAVALLFATAYAEDLQVCALLRRALLRRGVPAILTPPTAPRLRGGSLCVGATPVGALYRYFPTEYMEGQRNLDDIVVAVEDGAVRSLSSFAEIFAQSKLSFARAWALRDLLGRADQEVLQRHVPESFDLLDLDPGMLIAERSRWVLKRALGRVGDEVFVGDLLALEDWALLVQLLRARREGGEVWIGQRYVRQRPIPTPFGERLLTLGVYLLGGAFAGYFARLSFESHVSHDALCVPVFVAPEVS